MNIYLLTQDDTNAYDTYDSSVVCAEDETEASKIHPDDDDNWDAYYSSSWAHKPENVKVKYLGRANSKLEKGTILSSFNAG